MTAAEYYADLQAQVDQGHRPGLLDPVQAAMDWYREKYDAETLDGLTFTLMEGVPAGDLGSTIGRVTGQTGALESLFYLDGDPGSSEGRLAFHDPEFLSGEVRWYLYHFVWMEAQGPETIEGEAVRYQTESGDELLFLEEDGLLRVTIGDEVFWYRPAYAYQVSPYDKMLDCCAALAQEEDPFTWGAGRRRHGRPVRLAGGGGLESAHGRHIAVSAPLRSLPRPDLSGKWQGAGERP